MTFCGRRRSICRRAAASAYSIAHITKKYWWCVSIPSYCSGRSCRRARPARTVGKHRFKEIRAFERHLTRSGTLVLKFHLRISKEEQRKRFLARIDEPAKRWKFSMNDIKERGRWEPLYDGVWRR